MNTSGSALDNIIDDTYIIRQCPQCFEFLEYTVNDWSCKKHGKVKAVISLKDSALERYHDDCENYGYVG
jgi:hypothetical protein